MTPDQCVETILTKYAVPRSPTSPAEQLGGTARGPLRTWASQQLNALLYSGTGVRGISDVDVFISLKSNTTGTLKEIYKILVSLEQNSDWSPRWRNVRFSEERPHLWYSAIEALSSRAKGEC